MRFEYKGKWYDTTKSKGDESTNRLQVTEDKELQLTVIHKYYGEKTAAELLNKNELDVIFELALTNAKYTDIIGELSGFTKPGTYPDWVIKSAREQNDTIIALTLKDMLQDSKDATELAEKVKKFIVELGEVVEDDHD